MFPQYTKPQDTTKKYLPLGQVSKRIHRTNDPRIQHTTPATEKLSASFFGTDMQPKSLHPSPSPLPDIYTTCPELRQFKPLFTLSSRDETPNEAVLMPPAPQKPPKEQSVPPPPPPPTSIIAPPNSFDPEAPILHPHELGFVPQSEWPLQSMSLWDLRSMYFTRRNGAARQFDFKLYNALCITAKFPDSYKYVGAVWINQTVMKINSQIFANLLGIHAIQGGLFHKQGNFSRHGFTHIYKQSTINLQKCPLCDDVDDYNVRLYQDRLNRFCRGYIYRYGYE